MKCIMCGGTGSRAGAREAFVPRTGYVFAQADYPQLELYCLAQCCVSWFGQSKLADALNAGLDPHLQVASVIEGLTYADAYEALKDVTHLKHKATKKARSGAKPANFGWPGGSGPDSYVRYAKKAYGVTVTPAQAKAIKAYWLAAWPEMQKHFARARDLCDNDNNRATVETLWTKRYRGNATYCATCNNGFQALGADCAKRAAWQITKAQFVEEESPLFNTRTVAFIHDEFILEVLDDSRAHDAAHELARVMVAAANVYLPDVPIPLLKLEPTLMRRWSKNATQVWENGRLVPWAA